MAKSAESCETGHCDIAPDKPCTACERTQLVRFVGEACKSMENENPDKVHDILKCSCDELVKDTFDGKITLRKFFARTKPLLKDDESYKAMVEIAKEKKQLSQKF